MHHDVTTDTPFQNFIKTNFDRAMLASHSLISVWRTI